MVLGAWEAINMGTGKNDSILFTDIRRMIKEARSALAAAANAGLTLLYRRIGKRIHEEILKKKRAEYSKEIVVTLSRQLSWSHFIALIPMKIPLQREFRPVPFLNPFPV